MKHTSAHPTIISIPSADVAYRQHVERAAAEHGGPLAGHYWQEFVTPGSTEQVSAMLAILAEVGSVESRFRMPAADGSLVEFDSFTEVNGEAFTTTMRPRG